MESISRRIRAYRKLKRFTQQELAKGIDVSIDILGAVERGNRIPEKKLLEKISIFLKVDIDELVSED